MTAVLRVHVAALTSQPDLFWVTEERVAAACRRHPETARRVAFDWSWDHDRFAAGIARADIAIGWRFPRQGLRAMAPRLRWIALTGAGSEHLQPFDWVWPGLHITNNSGVHGAKAAEFAGAALLAMAHGLAFFADNKARRHWHKRFTTRIEGKTAVIIGLGGMGAATARWLKRRLAMRVIGVTRRGRPCRWADRVVATDAIDSVLGEADSVIVMAPLTEATRGLIDRRRLLLMKPGATLINMGRAGIVDNAALAELLTQGRLAAALLDVFDPEPLPPSSPLWQVPNLMLVPHCSSDDAETYIPETLDLFFANLARFLKGGRLLNRIATRRGY